MERGDASGEGVTIRRAETADEPAVLSLLGSSLGWLPDGLHRDFFRWKHQDNPFGRSPAWVAVAEGRVVGFRSFLRWEFQTRRGVVRAVRAVDTATHPDHRRRGIFRRLTLHALDDLRAEGVAFIFNTPNDQSRPGYLKMGWRQIGRVPLRTRPAGVAALSRMLRARVPAERWSVPTGAGRPASGVLQDEEQLRGLLASQPAPTALRTRRSPAYLSWRFGFGPLGYRALLAGDDPGEGMALFRLRRRGSAVEATVLEMLVPTGDRAASRRLFSRLLRETGADYAVATAPDCRAARFLPLPGVGPVLTARVVTARSVPRRSVWNLSLGDVELL